MHATHVTWPVLMLSGSMLIAGVGWVTLHRWYFGVIAKARAEIRHPQGRSIPGHPPQLLLGNIFGVYNAPNRLKAYHQFHERYGEIVQIFWMWRQQISVTNYDSAHRILVSRQNHYRKFPPNRLIQKLYGQSVLTQHGQAWHRQRLLMRDLFSPRYIFRFHDVFVAYGDELAGRWSAQLESLPHALTKNIYPDLIDLSLDIIARATLGADFGASHGKANRLLESIAYILKQSTQPVYQFTSWWQHLPLPANRKLKRAFQTIDDFLYGLIQDRRDAYHGAETAATSDLLDLLLQAAHSDESGTQALTDQEIRDNVLAIVINGHETVAIGMALVLYLLAAHPEVLAQVQQEIDQVMQEEGLTPAGVLRLQTLKAAIWESLRLYPPMVGLQRISQSPDTLQQWSIPTDQVVGIPLMLLHRDPEVFGDNADLFCPARYLGLVRSMAPNPSGACPMHGRQESRERSDVDTPLPLSFGDGARRCLGEAFALYEMTVVLAVLLHRFRFRISAADPVEIELGKFGLFISMLPKQGVTLQILPRLSADDRL